MSSGIYDLIYAGEYCVLDNIRNKLQAHWPEAKLEEEYDDIHQYRLSANVPADEDEYLFFAMNHGFALLSFMFQMLRLKYPEKLTELMKRWKASMKAEGRWVG